MQIYVNLVCGFVCKCLRMPYVFSVRGRYSCMLQILAVSLLLRC